jgi:hypothetical protein
LTGRVCCGDVGNEQHGIDTYWRGSLVGGHHLIESSSWWAFVVLLWIGRFRLGGWCMLLSTALCQVRLTQVA